MLAAKGESTVILFDKLDGLAHFIFRKAGFEVGEVKFAHKSPRHGITMQYRTVFGQGKTLESMSYGVSQIERLAYAVLFGSCSTISSFTCTERPTIVLSAE